MAIRVVLVGLGPVGSMIGRLLARKPWAEIVGGIDIAEELQGKDLGVHLGIGSLGVPISSNYDSVLTEARPDVAVVATVSYLRRIYSQLEKILPHGVDVVSTCEELVYPYVYDARLAGKIDALARRSGASVLGTGINPGFLMDTLAITLTTACQEVRGISIVRQMDASTRRGPFQRKIGAGLRPDEFKRKIEGGEISGHVGLEASIGLIASALGWSLSRIEKGPVEPIISSKSIETQFVRVEPGMVAGLRQTAIGVASDDRRINLEFKAYVGAEEEYDAIRIDGVPPINQRITPCVHGDLGTAAVVVNMIPRVYKAPPGLLTMKDMVLPSYVERI